MAALFVIFQMPDRPGQTVHTPPRNYLPQELNGLADLIDRISDTRQQFGIEGRAASSGRGLILAQAHKLIDQLV
jgi:hypothetical protein